MKTMKQVLSVATTVLVAALTMTGCGKNDSGNNNAGVGPYGGYPGAYGQCAGCVGNTQPIGQATASDAAGEMIKLTFYGTSGSNYGSAVGGQYSTVAVQGQLFMPPNGSGMSCGVPPGTYQITTSGAPAVMNGSRIDNMMLIATGPAQVQMRLNIYFLSPTQMQITRSGSSPSLMQGQGGYSQQPCELAMQ